MARSVVDQATDQLRELIARGAYQPGDRLPAERELAEGLRVSRPTVREAVRRLTDAGLLRPRRGSGTFVADIDLDAVFALRLRLEPYAAQLAADNRTEADLRRLRSLVRQLRAETEKSDAYAESDAQIYQVVIDAAANPILADILLRLRDLTKAVTPIDASIRAGNLRHMRKLARAIEDGDGVGAAAAMEDHLSELREVAHAWWQQFPRDRRVTGISPAA